jgi:hypothetical protein
MSETRRELPMQTRAAAVQTVDAEARTVELVWTTGSGVVRYDYWNGRRYLEELEISDKAVDMARLNNGAPLLNTHGQYDLRDVIGVVDRAWLKDGKGYASVRFSSRDDVEPFWRDVQAGIIRNVSVGYAVRTYEITEKAGEMPVYRATDWEPMELSLVPVPADAGAGTRAAPTGAVNPCLFVNRAMPASEETTMDPTVQAAATAPAPTTAAPSNDEAIRAATAAERTRVSEITNLAARHGLPADFVQRHIDSGATVDAVRSAALDMLATRTEGGQRPGGGSVQLIADHEDPAAMRSAMATAIAARVAPQFVKMTDQARAYARLSVLEMVGELMGKRGFTGQRSRATVADVLFSRGANGAHTSSDFPLLLQDAANKILLPAYAAAPASYRRWAAQRPFNDFKAHKFLRVGDFPRLTSLAEAGELRYGTISENREQITAVEYATGVQLGRRMLMNDDLSVFSDLATIIAVRIASEENRLVYSVIANDGPTLSDGTAMFATSATIRGGNKAGSGTTIDLTNVAAGRAVVYKQTGIDGVPLNLQATKLVVGPDRELLARQLLSQVQAAQISNVNVYAGLMEPVVDAQISGNRWYLFAEPTAAPAVVYGYVDGNDGPMVTTDTDFDTQSLKVRVGLDFAAGAVDWRPAYLNTGA